MWLQVINRMRVCLISFKRLVMILSIVVQMKELEVVEKVKKYTRVERNRESQKSKTTRDRFIYFSHCHVLLKTSCNHRTILWHYFIMFKHISFCSKGLHMLLFKQSLETARLCYLFINFVSSQGVINLTSLPLAH